MRPSASGPAALTAPVFAAVFVGAVAFTTRWPEIAAFAATAAMTCFSALISREVAPTLPSESRRRAMLDSGFTVLLIAGSFWNLLLTLDAQPASVVDHVAVACVLVSLLSPTALSAMGMVNDPTERRFRRLAFGSATAVIAGMAWAAGPAAGRSARPFGILAILATLAILRALVTASTGTRPEIDVLARLQRRGRVVTALHAVYVATLVVAMWTTAHHEVMGSIAALVLILAIVTQHAAARENLDLHRQLATRLNELEASEDRLRILADTDELTGLVNRRSFVELLDRHLRRGLRCSVLFIDLDRFKEINDSLGHEAGDDVLVHVSSRLVDALGPTATVGRFGGDEFVALLPDTSSEGAAAWGQRLLAVLSESTVVKGVEAFLAASIGVAQSAPDSCAGTLLRDADVAMYAAKAQGRSRVAVFDPALLAQAEERLHIAADLHRALGSAEIEPFFQPIVDVEDGRLRGFEALVRWRHPVRGVLSPGTFIDVADDTALIVPMGSQVLAAACRHLGEWTRRGLIEPDIGVAVNLAPRQLIDRAAIATVSEALVESGIDACRLTIEITESALMSDGDEVDAVVRQLRELGVRFSVDDFGTGYSSLTYLKRFPVDTLKIDREFVDGLPNDDGDAVIVDAVIGLASALGLVTVAEGVERPEQLEHLRSRGCSRIQGYLIARPMPVAEVESWLGVRSNVTVSQTS